MFLQTKAILNLSRLATAIALFSWVQRKAEVTPSTSSIELRGISAYHGVLNELSRDSRLAARVQVIPGTIELISAVMERLI